MKGLPVASEKQEGREKPRSFPSVPVTTKPPRPASSEPRTKRANHQDFQSIQTKAASRYEERGALEQRRGRTWPRSPTPTPAPPHPMAMRREATAWRDTEGLGTQRVKENKGQRGPKH